MAFARTGVALRSTESQPLYLAPTRLAVTAFFTPAAAVRRGGAVSWFSRANMARGAHKPAFNSNSADENTRENEQTAKHPSSSRLVLRLRLRRPGGLAPTTASASSSQDTKLHKPGKSAAAAVAAASIERKAQRHAIAAGQHNRHRSAVGGSHAHRSPSFDPNKHPSTAALAPEKPHEPHGTHTTSALNGERPRCSRHRDPRPGHGAPCPVPRASSQSRYL